MTFLAGLAGLTALLPIGRLAVGRWGGLVAIGLCLTSGCVYGNLFFNPIDVPFLFAMTWATLAIIVMASRVVPSWPATISTGLLTGMAIATRSSGVITHAYLFGAMLLCGLEAIVRPAPSTRSDLLRIGVCTCFALAIAWITAIALWPWLQIGNPFSQFKVAFLYFANHPNSFEIPFLGRDDFDHCATLVLHPGTADRPSASGLFVAARDRRLVRARAHIRILARNS